MQLLVIVIQMHGIIFSALLTGPYARWSCCVDTSTKEYVKSTQITGFAKRVNLAILQRFFFFLDQYRDTNAEFMYFV